MNFVKVAEDVLEDPDHPGYWIRLDQWNRFRNDTYKNNRDAELPFILDTALVSQPSPTNPTEKSASGGGSLISPVYRTFERIAEDTHVALSGKHAGKPRNFTLWKCRLCSKSSSFKVFGGSTGVLFKHLARYYHPAEHTEARVASKHSKLKLEDDGSITELYSFPDALPHHVRFLLWHVLDLGHLHKAKSQNFREFTSGLDKRYVPPCRSTCENISEIVRELMMANLLAVIAETKQQLGEPCFGLQSDLWSPQDNKNRLLESDIKMALTGVESGSCEEIPVFVLPRNSTTTGASGDSDGEISDADGDESDADQVEANEREGKEFPLQHRCLGASDWKQGRQMESCLVTPYECSQAMQGHQAVGLDKEYVLACATHRTLTADKVEIVSGNEVNESWHKVHADSLPADIKQFRRITAEQIEKRLLLTLDDDTLLALKMNPSIDTSETGPLFIGKSTSLELVDAVYNRQLRLRGKHLYSVGAIKLRGSQEGGTLPESSASISQPTTAASASDQEALREVIERSGSQYEFLRPTVDQIGAAYLKKYGREIPEPEYEVDEDSDCEAECDLE
ncbi:hypothetical protein CYMTET_9444 [Cymbomonas tetramitiformis]|uniref:Uncharacterized protein n=1 Tax=Cymbomonas tetramitiformis TaxID=36881 RepID=A0AAE0GRH1_9CHLO|nr:hypothetical protein CYMTET_9444 [Cymbomonas tetramitiformis]